MSSYVLTCLICGVRMSDLGAIQEHAMDEHGYLQDDHGFAKRRTEPGGAFVWTFPDGVDWMRAAEAK